MSVEGERAKLLAVLLDLTAGETKLREFVAAVRSGEDPSAELIAWLANRFEKIIAGEEPTAALELKKRRGRKRNLRSQEEQILNCARIIEKMRSGRTYGEAIDEVAREAQLAGVDIDERTLKRHYSAHKDFVNTSLRLAEVARNPVGKAVKALLDKLAAENASDKK